MANPGTAKGGPSCGGLTILREGYQAFVAPASFYYLHCKSFTFGDKHSFPSECSPLLGRNIHFRASVVATYESLTQRSFHGARTRALLQWISLEGVDSHVHVPPALLRDPTLLHLYLPYLIVQYVRADL